MTVTFHALWMLCALGAATFAAAARRDWGWLVALAIGLVSIAAFPGTEQLPDRRAARQLEGYLMKERDRSTQARNEARADARPSEYAAVWASLPVLGVLLVWRWRRRGGRAGNAKRTMQNARARGDAMFAFCLLHCELRVRDRV